MTLRLDITESTLGATVGLIVAVSANHTVLPFFGFRPSIDQSIQIGLVFFAISVAQRLVFRRLFRRIAGWLS